MDKNHINSPYQGLLTGSWGEKICTAAESLGARPNFCGRIPRELECISNLKEVPCPCCGRLKMLKSEFSKFKWPSHNQPVSTSFVISDLAKTFSNLCSDEKEVLIELKKLNKEHPKTRYSVLLEHISNPPQLFVSYLSKSKKLTEREYNKKVFLMLNKFKKQMHPTEKKAFEVIEKAHKKNKNLSMRLLVQSLRPQYIKKLQKEQFIALDNIGLVIDKLPKEESEKIKELLNRSKSIIIADASDDPFRRKVFIAKAHAIIDPLPKSDVKFEILRIMNKLPNSSTSVSAFIVKYSGYVKVFNKNTSQFELKSRSSKGIGEGFICKSQNSLEHVKAKSAIRSVKNKNNPSHLTFECAGCNNARGHTPLDEWVMLNPQMPKNTQKAFNSLIKISNSGKHGIVRYEWYIRDLANTFEQESKGLIKVDTSKLKQKTPPLDLASLVNHFRHD